MKISERLGAWKNAMLCNDKPNALRWASQCIGLAISMAWIISAILSFYFA
jgi:hypothetical protein